MHMHVGAVMVFDPSSSDGGERHVDALLSTGCATSSSERIHLVPPLRRRVVRVPFGLHHPVWVEDPHFELDYHLRRASLPAPGGPGELAAFVADHGRAPPGPEQPAVGDARRRRARVRTRGGGPEGPPCAVRRCLGGRGGGVVPRPGARGARRRTPAAAVATRAHPHRGGADRLGGVVARPPTRDGPPACCGGPWARCTTSPSGIAGCARRTTRCLRLRPSGRRAPRSTAPSLPTGDSPSPRFPWTRSAPCAGSSAARSTTSCWPRWRARCGACWPSVGSGSRSRSSPWCRCRGGARPIGVRSGTRSRPCSCRWPPRSPTPSSATPRSRPGPGWRRTRRACCRRS